MYIQAFRLTAYKLFAGLGKEDPLPVVGIKASKHGFHFFLSHKLLAQRVQPPAQTDLS